MNEIVYFAEIEIYQKEDINLDQLEHLVDSIFESQENLPEEDQMIDEDKVGLDEEDGYLIIVTRDFETLEQLKEEVKKLISAQIDSEIYNFSAHVYKDEYVALIESVDQF